MRPASVWTSSTSVTFDHGIQASCRFRTPQERIKRKSVSAYRVYQAWSRRTIRRPETTLMTIRPRTAAKAPPPWPTAKPVTSAMTTMIRISLLASSRKAAVAGSSTRMKISSCVRYDCRTSSGVGRTRERNGWRRAGPAGRLVIPEAREELRTAMDDVRHQVADVAEEGPDRIGRARWIAVDEH